MRPRRRAWTRCASTGSPAERVLLIGGAAQNPAVQAIAAQVLDAPVVIPQPGEYVALGAAVQAEWARSGTRPSWEPNILASLKSDARPEILTAYRAAADRVS